VTTTWVILVAAVPLEPPAWIIGMESALLAPNRQRLARVDTEEVEGAVTPFEAQFGSREPASGKLIAGVAGRARHGMDAKWLCHSDPLSPVVRGALRDSSQDYWCRARPASRLQVYLADTAGAPVLT